MEEKIEIGTEVWVVLDDTIRLSLRPELVKGMVKGVSCESGDHKYCIDFGDYFVITGTSNMFTDETCALRMYSERLERYLSILISDAQELTTKLQRKYEKINEVEEQLAQCLKERCNKLLNK